MIKVKNKWQYKAFRLNRFNTPEKFLGLILAHGKTNSEALENAIDLAVKKYKLERRRLAMF